MKYCRMILVVLTLTMVLFFVPVTGAGEFNYVGAAALDVVALLPAPPAADSEETKAELDLIVRVQEARTPAQVARVTSESKVEMNSFSRAIGPWFNSSNLPITAMLLRKLEKDSKLFSESGKNAFGRKRPRFADPRVKVVIEGQDEACYPSGHATRGMLIAIILARLIPGKKAAIMEKGWEIGWNRVVAGVHYPSDIVAGRVVGQAIAVAAQANPAFRDDFDKARAEIDAAGRK
ncbi:MAG: phosphatase PAP2 family protein [bacterium]